jgi:AcrR family transcriptional regulator
MPSMRERILAAAAEAFESRGPAHTTMAEIAEAAGVDRKTVYRVFANRTALLDAVAIERINNTRDVVRELVDECITLQEAVVRGIVEALRHFREDRVLMTAIEATTDRGIERYLVSADSPVTDLMVEVWKGTFARARRAGELRRDLDDRSLANWLLGVFLILLLRDDLDWQAQTDLITILVLPGLRPV